MRFLRCAAILFFSAALTAGAAKCADTTKADDKKPAAASGDAGKTTVTTGATAAADPAVTDTVAATPTDAAAATDAAPATDATTTPALARAPVNTALAAAAGGGNSSSSESPAFTPMPALDGNPGLFTLETGETLPKHGFSLGIGLNKFSRMPGEVTSLQLIPAVGYGVTRWFSLFFNIDAQDHIHVGAPSQLSLSAVNELNNPQFQQHDLPFGDSVDRLPAGIRGRYSVCIAHRDGRGRNRPGIQDWIVVGAPRENR